MKEYRKKLRIKYIDMLWWICVICWSNDNLEFDHIDEKSKLNTISNMIANWDKNIHNELKKCQLLCKQCHSKKTSKYLSNIIPKNKGVWNHWSTWYNKMWCRCDICRDRKSQYRRKYDYKK